MLGSARSRLAVAAALGIAFALGTLLPSALGKFVVDPELVVRDALAQAERVQGAPGRTLVLSRVAVEPGAELPVHHHLGTQVARVQAGVLDYTVRRGSVTVRQGESDKEPRVVRKIVAGQTARLGAGDWIVEQPSDVHQATNRGREPVVIYIATLLKSGAPPSTPVTLPPGG